MMSGATFCRENKRETMLPKMESFTLYFLLMKYRKKLLVFFLDNMLFLMFFFVA